MRFELKRCISLETYSIRMSSPVIMIFYGLSSLEEVEAFCLPPIYCSLSCALALLGDLCLYGIPSLFEGLLSAITGDLDALTVLCFFSSSYLYLFVTGFCLSSSSSDKSFEFLLYWLYDGPVSSPRLVDYLLAFLFL